jgi:hypothetical protein
LIKGRALDNVLTEQSWLARKYEDHWRPHQSLVYQTLAEVCFQTATARQKQMAVIKSTLAAKGK